MPVLTIQYTECYHFIVVSTQLPWIYSLLQSAGYMRNLGQHHITSHHMEKTDAGLVASESEK